MAMKRLLIEFGQGVDMHGGDQNNAVRKATEDAIHHCCMAGISEILRLPTERSRHLSRRTSMRRIRRSGSKIVTDYLHWWNVEAEVHHGGANRRIALNGKPKTEITIAIVALTVYVDA